MRLMTVCALTTALAVASCAVGEDKKPTRPPLDAKE